jgi:uncharacterized protein YkwD
MAQALRAAVLIALFVTTGRASILAAVAHDGAAAASAIRGMLVDLTNAERANAGVVSLEANDRLMRAAQIDADQLGDHGTFAHVLPDAPYPRPYERLAAADYRWRAYGENIATTHDADRAMQLWMESPGHRANILNGRFTQIGIGYATAADGRRYYVQVFGRPAI